MQPIERYLLATHRCSDRCRQRGRGLKEHNAFALAALNAFGDVKAQPFIEAAIKRGDIKTASAANRQPLAAIPRSAGKSKSEGSNR